MQIEEMPVILPPTTQGQAHYSHQSANLEATQNTA